MAEASKLTNEIRAFVVQSLAMFDSPKTVAESVKTEFTVEITRPSIERYDPTKYAGQGLAKKWADLFAPTRKEFLDDIRDIGISHRSVRIKALQRMAAKAEDMKNLALVAPLYEQAAKERAIRRTRQARSGNMKPARFSAGQQTAREVLAEPQRYSALVGGTRSVKTFLTVRAIVHRGLRGPNSRHAILRFRANAASFDRSGHIPDRDAGLLSRRSL